MHTLDHVNGILRRHRRQDAMAEVEDETGTAGVLLENPFHLNLNVRLGGVKHGRIQIPLHRNLRTEDVASGTQVDGNPSINQALSIGSIP